MSFKHIPDDEPIFVIRAQDPMAVQIVQAWADEAEKQGVAPKKLFSARNCAREMKEWKPRKLPD